MTPRTYTAGEILAETGISRQRLNQLRTGYTAQRKRKDGSVRKYVIAGTLIEGEDWHWSAGKVVYHASALKKIQARKG
jgi:hypothetical protein